MLNPSSAALNPIKLPRLTRNLSALETSGFGLSGLLLWLGTAPALHLELDSQALWIWIPSAIVGILLNLQVQRLGTTWQNVSGGTPNYMTRLLKNYPNLARYAAIGYWLGWVSVPSINAMLLTDVIKEHLIPLGVDTPELPLKIGLTLLPFIVAFSGARALGILHLVFILPAIGFFCMFCAQGMGWLAIAPDSPGLFPSTWNMRGGEPLSFVTWAKWFFIAVYAAYGCETASSFVAESRKPVATLRTLSLAAILLPLVYLGGSWVMMRLGSADHSPFLELVSTAVPFWGKNASTLMTFLITSGCLLSSATAVSNTPRILYQLSLDQHLAPIFAVSSRQGVLAPSLIFTGLFSIACLIWNDVTRITMVTGTGYFMSIIALHWGLWLRRKSPESRWGWWSLGFAGVELVALVVGGLAWSWQDFLIGLLLPIAVLLFNAGIQRFSLPLLQPSWWLRHYPSRRFSKDADWMMIQVCVLIFLVCGATTVGWISRAKLDGLAWSNHSDLFVVLLVAIAFVGVAIACWTSLPHIEAIAVARKAAEHLFVVAQDAIIVVDATGKIQKANPAARRLFSSSDRSTGPKITHQHLSQYLTGLTSYPEDWAPCSEQSLIFGEEVKVLEAAISDRTTQDQQEFVVILRDITARKQAESQLREQKQQLEAALAYIQATQSKLVQNEKMSSLGQLVAGIAHEINNPINFIYGNLSHANAYTQDLIELLHLYEQYGDPSHPKIQRFAAEIDLEFLVEDVPKLLNSMQSGANRIQNIVASLRNFSRMDEADMKEVDIHEGIDSTLMILQNRIKAKPDEPGITVVKSYGKLPLVECYASQLNQVFMNILNNALDALEDRMSTYTEIQGGDRNPAPTITIRTQLVDSGHIAILFSNNGDRIPETIQHRIFDPFFTTKPVGRGTGLGLSISYDVITEKHKGYLHCLSSSDTETTFVIEIPIRQSVIRSIY